MIVSLTQFNTYTNNFEDATDIVTMKTSMLTSAQEIVSEYLGFDPESATRTDYISGIGNNHLYLFAHPITTVTSVEIDGTATTDYTINGRYLRLNDGVWPVGVENVKVTYTAGWSAANMPSTITMVILQIASLMLEEANGNIGITGKSFAENSRTFINYTNFDKWLKKLDPLRIVRLV